MEDKKITIELKPLLANCLQRMLVNEIENQQIWIVEEEQEFGINKEREELRNQIISECEELREQLEKQGIHKHYKI